MDADEREVHNYLESYHGQYVSVKEICRRASTKKRYAQEPEWAREVLKRMKDQGLVESNMTGRYRLKEAHGEKERHMSEETNKIIEEGAQQGQAGINIDVDED